MKAKKGSVGDTSSGDTSVVVADKFHYIKIILIVTILLIYLVIPGMRYINSKAPVPDTLETDLLIERLTNVCFASQHEPFTTLDQKIIDISKFTPEQLRVCFGDLSNDPIQRAVLSWREGSQQKSEDIILADTEPDQTIFVYVLVKMENGELFPGRLELRK